MTQRRPSPTEILASAVSILFIIAGPAFDAKIPPLDPAVKKGIDKVAELLGKNDTTAAEKLVAELSKNPSAGTR